MIKACKHLVFLCVVSCLSQFAQAAEDPYVAVTRATDQLLAKLIEVKPLYESNKPAFFKAVDESLSAFVDFEGFSKSVMAKYYRKATPEQRLKFENTFRSSLIETYAEALVGFDNQKIEVIKPTKKPKKPNKSTIHLKIHGVDGTIYKVVYKLRLIEDDWKLRNIQIDAFNLGLQFRSQFKDKMEDNKQNIDAVICNWLADE